MWFFCLCFVLLGCWFECFLIFCSDTFHNSGNILPMKRHNGWPLMLNSGTLINKVKSKVALHVKKVAAPWPTQFVEVLCFKSHIHVLGIVIKVKHLFMSHFPGNFKERSQLNYVFGTFLRWTHFLKLYCFTEKWNDWKKKKESLHRMKERKG